MRSLLFILLFSLVCTCFSQQLPSFTQYNLNKFALNPAVAGSKACDNLNFGGELQWLGFENAPELFFVSLHTRINKTQRSPLHVQGLGFFLAQEKVGIQQKLYLKFAYSYHFALGKNHMASVGLFVGAQKWNYKNVHLYTPAGLVDPAFQDMEEGYVFPEISPGLFVEGKNLYGGFSVMQAYPVRLKSSRTNFSPHFYLLGGYHIGKYNWTFTPSFLLSTVPAAPPTADFSFSLDYRKKFLLAIGGKYANSVYFTVHLRLLKWLKVAYSYTYPISQINNVGMNSQSITISISGCDNLVERPQFYCPVFR